MEPINLTLYRRHVKTCPEFTKSDSRTKLHCSGARPCPMYVDGFVHGKRVRKSLGSTRDLQRGLAMCEAMAHNGSLKPAVAVSNTLSDLVNAFLAEKKFAGACEGTLHNYRWVLEPLAAFCPKPDLNSPSFAELLKDFCLTQNWKTDNSKRGGVIKLKTFCAWLADNDKAPKNWGKKLVMPPDPGGQTAPFTDEEIAKLLAACDQLRGGGDLTAEQTRARAIALILVLLYTGLRISDIVTLKRSAVADGYITLPAIRKTGEPIRLLLHPSVIAALALLTPRAGLRDGYFFWNANAKTHVQANAYRQILKFVMEHAGVEDVRPHRFRDTFALALLDGGADLSEVQLLLGHKSIETTQRWYRHFSKKQQARMDVAISRLNFQASPLQPGPHAGSDTGRDAQANVIPFRATA